MKKRYGTRYPKFLWYFRQPWLRCSCGLLLAHVRAAVLDREGQSCATSRPQLCVQNVVYASGITPSQTQLTAVPHNYSRLFVHIQHWANYGLNLLAALGQFADILEHVFAALMSEDAEVRWF